MPPKPLLTSTRAQSVAVAVVMALVLVCATGLASLQAGSGPEYLNTSTRRELKLVRPEGKGGQDSSTVLFDLPDGWTSPESKPGGLVLIDPNRPNRRLSLVTVVASKQTSPKQMITRFIQAHPDPSVRATLRPAAQPFVFSLPDAGLRGAQFIGISDSNQGSRGDRGDRGSQGDDPGMVREHLMACLSPDGIHYWLIYLTDSVEQDSDVGESLRANSRLLQTVYRSARVAPQ